MLLLLLIGTYIPPYRQYRTEIQNCLCWRSSARHQRLGTDSSYLLMPALGDLNSLPWPGQVWWTILASSIMTVLPSGLPQLATQWTKGARVEALSALGSNPVCSRSGNRIHAACIDSQLPYQLSYRGCHSRWASSTRLAFGAAHLTIQDGLEILAITSGDDFSIYLS